MLSPAFDYLNKTRLVQEVPGTPVNEKWYIWDGKAKKVVWHGPCKETGKAWALTQGLLIEEIEYFEP